MEFLKGLFEDGKPLTYDELSSKIRENNMKVVNLKDGGYVSEDKYSNSLMEIKNLKEQIGTRDSQLKELRELEPEKMKGRIVELESENEKTKYQYENEIKQLKLNNIVELALRDSKAKNVKAVKSLLDIDYENVNINDKGSIDGLTEKINAIIESDPYLFSIDDSKSKFNGIEPENGIGKNLPEDKSKWSYEDFLNNEQ